MNNFTKLSEWVWWYKTVQKEPNLDSVTHPRLFWKTDDSVSVPIFRKDQFQVEIYLVDDLHKIPKHSHPGVQVAQEILEERGSWSVADTLTFPATHGGSTNPIGCSSPGVILTYELWDPLVEPTSLAVRWSGKSVGPLQESLILHTYPRAVIKNGWVLSLD